MLLLAAALLIPDSTSGMIWHPKNPKNSMWDTWLYASPGQDAVSVKLSSTLPLLLLADTAAGCQHVLRQTVASSTVSVLCCTSNFHAIDLRGLHWC